MFQQFSDDDDHNNRTCDKDHNVDGDDAWDDGDDHNGNADALCGYDSDGVSDIDNMDNVHSGDVYDADDGHNGDDAYGNHGGGSSAGNILSILFQKTVGIKSAPVITKKIINKIKYIQNVFKYDVLFNKFSFILILC